MINKICIFIQTWRTEDFGNIKKLAELNYPIIVSAPFLQHQENADEFLSLFNENQVHILSEDVDLNLSELTVALHAALKMQMSHFVLLNDFSESLLAHLKDLEALLIENSDAALFSIICKKKEAPKKSTLMKKIMNSDNVDYRSYWTKNNIYTLKDIVNIKEGKGLSEIKILIQLLKARKKIIPLYIEASEVNILGGNFKKKMKDYFYEIYLITYSALISPITPTRAGLSFGMGIFVACTPFYGLQSVLILLFSYIFRLNFPIAYLASQISLPPFYAILVPIQLYVGQLILNKPFFMNGNYIQIAQENFNSWLIGSLVVGFALSLVSGYIWFLVQSRFSKSKLQVTKV